MNELMELLNVTTEDDLTDAIWDAYENGENKSLLSICGYRFRVLEKDCCGPLVVGLFKKDKLVFTIQ